MGDSPTSATLTERPRRREDVRLHVLDGEGLIYDPLSADTHRLNQTALFIWQQCDGVRDAEQIARRVTVRYEVLNQTALEHVEALFAEFAIRGLVVVADEPSLE